MLTEVAIRNAKPKEKPCMMPDGNLLYLLVTPTGGKLWRMKYRFKGKQQTLALQKALGGSSAYPEISLKEARQLRNDAKKLLAAGIDPAGTRREEKIAEQEKEAHTFRNIAEEWFAIWRVAKARVTVEHVRSRLDRFILPGLGDMPVATVKAPDVLVVLRPIEAQGLLDTVQRVKTDVSQILEYAIAGGLRELVNPCPALSKILKKNVVKHQAAILEPEKLAELLRAIDGYKGQSNFVQAALRLLPLLFCRPGELITMRWADVDLNCGEWRYIVSKTKKAHLVPLANQAVEILSELTGYRDAGAVFVFPSRSRRGGHMSNMSINRALQAMGYDTQNEITGHGFRRTASTFLNEQGYNYDWIERQLSHGERDKVRDTYNDAKYLKQRKTMMQEWANYMDQLRQIS